MESFMYTSNNLKKLSLSSTPIAGFRFYFKHLKLRLVKVMLI